MFLPESIICVFIVVVVAIILDVILGAIKAAKDDFDAFNLRTLPKFLATGILPYAGSLLVLALAAQFAGDPFTALFYASAAAVTAKYVAEIKDKLEFIFGIGIEDDTDGS